MNSINETGCARTIVILAGIATIVGVVIAILAWLMPFSPVGSSPFLPSTATTDDTPRPAWELGKLVYEETFEDLVINELRTKFGNFDIVTTSSGNHVWRTNTQGASEVVLPTTLTDYAVETKIMQVSGKQGLAGIYVRASEGGCPGYQTYMDVAGGWMNLIEKSASCEETRETGLFSNYRINLRNGAWYSLRIEVKEAEVRVYLDGQFIMRDQDIDGTVQQSSSIGFWACCEDLLPYVIDFDDIRVWLLKP